MAVTVAPLTTDVMNAVEEDRIGTASGINNAVARVAGVLGIAVLGIAMVWAFRTQLDRTLMHLSLPPAALRQIHAQETRLAALQPPAGLDAPTAAAITTSVRQGFVFGFRIVMMICAALALASAMVAWRMVPGPGDLPQRPTQNSPP
jgi:predicted MFS family arabinose efflux permease